MPVLTVFNPDGTPLVAPDGKPLRYERPDDRRALLSAVKAWWPTTGDAKRASAPGWGEAPEGAEIRRDGQPWMLRQSQPVYGADGEITDARLEWVDVAEEAAAAEKAARIEAVKAKLASGTRKPRKAVR